MNTATDSAAGDLALAATGDTEAFMRFYDATSQCAFTLALARARSRGLRGTQAQRSAESETEAAYVEAWRRCDEHRSSDLSPMAWLFSLPHSRDASYPLLGTAS